MMRASLAAAIGVAFALGAAAAGAPGWGTPIVLSSGDRVLDPHFALNAAGDALVAWDHEVGSECPTSPASLSCVHIVEVAARARGSRAWLPPAELNRPGVASRPRVAIDASGNAAVVWVHDIGRDRVLQATYRHGPLGTFPEPNDVSEPRLEITGHQIAFDAAGNAIVIWAERQRSDSGLVVRAAVRTAALGAWSSPVSLSDSGTSSYTGAADGPSLAVTQEGRATVAWVDYLDHVHVARGDVGTGVWEASVEVSVPYGRKRGSRLATNSAGDTAVVWAREDPAGSAAFVEAVFGLRAGGWTQHVEIGQVRTTSADDLEVAIDEAGNVLFAWVEPTNVLQAAVLAHDGGLRMWSISAARGEPSQPRLAVDESGNVVLAWTSRTTGIVRAAIKPGTSGVWEPQIAVSGSGASAPRIAMDADGDAVAVWNRSVAERVVVETTDLSADGPILQRLTVPKKAVVVGTRVRFSVRAHPWGSPLLGDPVWRFGDGTSARRALVTHTYRRVGRYDISVSQMDADRATSTSEASVLVIGARVRNTRPPSIRGSARVGSTLTCLRGIWTGSRPIRFTFRWRRDGREILGAMRRRYRIARRDVGSLLACEVQASNAAGSAWASSDLVGVRP